MTAFAHPPTKVSSPHASRSVSTKKPSKAKKSKTRQRGQKAPMPDRIGEIQSVLARGGYYEGEPNGKMNEATQDGLRRFQHANGLNPSGKIDALTLQKLGLGSDTAGLAAPRPPLPPASASPTNGPSPL
jgi:peptidoglycan hydrolase-like protein with peptidoglycan-binding domain